MSSAEEVSKLGEELLSDPIRCSNNFGKLLRVVKDPASGHVISLADFHDNNIPRLSAESF